eukprot:CAMPEP_0169453858 /NCGR_PEP_ID=MMETSP1042-20121227/14974_1 /TAXON_ID=464988 /ORGANISM="Hemiselmis andersenii, Strain CCMP1180" /LENGTH=269 /DNA_ID=CAMNT_0009565903 /DNA_START=21 /DNA_END=827 /DNA_ORIENTATION=-
MSQDGHEDENMRPMLNTTGGGADEDLTKYSVNELRDKLKMSRKETGNRDVTIRALQRNYEALCTTHDEAKTEHVRRKEAFDALTDKYAQTEVKLTAEIEKNRKLQKGIADAQHEVSGAKKSFHEAKMAEDKAKEELRLGLDKLLEMEEQWEGLQVELAEGRAALNRTERILTESNAAGESLKRAAAGLEQALAAAKREVSAWEQKGREMDGLRARNEALTKEAEGKAREAKNADATLKALREARSSAEAKAADLERQLATAKGLVEKGA